MKLRSFLITILFLHIVSDSKVLGQYPSYRIYPSESNQIEPSIVVHPTNPNIMFASAFTIRFSFRSEGVYLTTNGGLNWFGSDTLAGSPISNHGGDPGPIIDKNGNLIITHQGGFILGMYSNFSTNMGQTWSANYQIAGNDQDKGSPATDNVSVSPYYGRTYLVWTRFTNPYPIVMSYTTNSGANWTAISQVNNSLASRQSVGPTMSIGPDGKSYVSWASAILSSPFNEDCIGFAVSSNGGVNWNVTECAYDCNGVKSSSLAPWGIRVNGYPAMDIDKTGGTRNGWIYILTAEKNLAPAGTDPDIVFHRSTDGGNTFSQGVRVNQDPINNGKIQVFPAVTVDPTGGINVVYFDQRNSPDSAQLYLSRSTNGGENWADYLVSDHKFLPKSISGAGSGNQGDNIGITYSNNKLWPVWMDDKTGIYQVYTAPIDLNTVSVSQISSAVPEKFTLHQNYPNPFNPGTIISYQLSKFNFVSLKVYDLLGSEVAELVNENQVAGSYEVVFDGAYLPSGVYLYELKTPELKETKRMVLLK